MKFFQGSIKRTFSVGLMLIIFVPMMAAAFLVGHLYERAAQTRIEGQIDKVNASILKQFNHFDRLLNPDEARIAAEMKRVLPLISADLMALGRPAEIPPAELARIARAYGMDELYVIDAERRVVNTTFDVDLGLDLGAVSERLRRFLDTVYGAGVPRVERVTISTNTGLLQKYGYYSPEGADHIIEASVLMRDAIAREHSPDYAAYLFDSMTREIIQGRAFLTDADLFVVNDLVGYSFFNVGRQLPREMRQALANRTSLTVRDGDRLLFFKRINWNHERLRAFNYLVIQTAYDLSAFRQFTNRATVLVAVVLAIASIIVYLAANFLTERLFATPINRMRDVLGKIGLGNYEDRLELSDSEEFASLIQGIEQMRQRIRDREAELAAANRELDAYAYSVSHDLRAPLRAIDGFAGILLEDFADRLGEEGREQLELVRSSAIQMREMIDGLLELSRQSRGRMEREILDLSALVREAFEDQRRLHPERVAHLDLQAGLAAMADGRLTPILVKILMENAWKYTQGREEAHIRFGEKRLEEGGAAFFIADDGVGFDMASAKGIFEPFRRLHRSEAFPGIGIGLATAQRIINRHGGRIWAEAAPGQGATFYFTLS